MGRSKESAATKDAPTSYKSEDFAKGMGRKANLQPRRMKNTSRNGGICIRKDAPTLQQKKEIVLVMGQNEDPAATEDAPTSL